MLDNVHQADGVTVVRLSGRLDVAAVDRLKPELHRLIAAGHNRLVLDLEALEFIDSTGLGLLVGCLRRCVAAGGDLCLTKVSQFLRSVFELTRLTRVFQLTDSEAEAIEAVQAGPQQ